MKIFTVETDAYKYYNGKGLLNALNEFTIIVYDSFSGRIEVEERVYTPEEAMALKYRDVISAVVTVRDEWLHMYETPDEYVNRIYDDYIHDMIYD